MCDPLNRFVVGGRSFPVRDSVRSFPNVFFIKDSIFACTISTKRASCEFAHPKNRLSGGQEQEQVFVATEFTDQVSSFVELK